MAFPSGQEIIVTSETVRALQDLPWKAHASCAGVFLKHLVTAADTQGQFSCHLVRVQAGCEISEHTHPDHWELHEVVAGQGRAFLRGNELAYRPGNIVVIPLGEKHRVVAAGEDLYLWAKFVPALL